MNKEDGKTKIQITTRINNAKTEDGSSFNGKVDLEVWHYKYPYEIHIFNNVEIEDGASDGSNLLVTDWLVIEDKYEDVDIDNSNICGKIGDYEFQIKGQGGHS